MNASAVEQVDHLFTSFQKSPIAFPIYHVPRLELLKSIPDKYSSIFAPFATCECRVGVPARPARRAPS